MESENNQTFYFIYNIYNNIISTFIYKKKLLLFTT